MALNPIPILRIVQGVLALIVVGTAGYVVVCLALGAFDESAGRVTHELSLVLELLQTGTSTKEVAE